MKLKRKENETLLSNDKTSFDGSDQIKTGHEFITSIQETSIAEESEGYWSSFLLDDLRSFSFN